MEQYFPAPAPSKTEFNTLNTQVQGLADQIANSGTLLASNTTEGSTLTGSVDTTGYSMLLVFIRVKNSGNLCMVYPTALNNYSIIQQIPDNTTYWANVKFIVNNGTYTISFDAKGSSISAFTSVMIYGII